MNTVSQTHKGRSTRPVLPQELKNTPKVPQTPKLPKLPKEKLPKKISIGPYLRKFEILLRGHYAPMNMELSDETVFITAAKSYQKYKGILDDFTSDVDLSKFVLSN